MSLAQLDHFLSLRESNPLLAERLASPLDLEDFLQLAREWGFELTETDVLDAQKRAEGQCSALQRAQARNPTFAQLHSWISRSWRALRHDSVAMLTDWDELEENIVRDVVNVFRQESNQKQRLLIKIAAHRASMLILTDPQACSRGFFSQLGRSDRTALIPLP